MKKIRISLMTLFVLTAITFSFTSFSEPGSGGELPGTYAYCGFHGEFGFGVLPAGSNPADCEKLSGFSAAELLHLDSYHSDLTIQEKTDFDSTHCLTLDPFE